MREFGLQVVIVDNGFVYVGMVAFEEGYYLVTVASNVRKAGTSKGFGQIAFEGPNRDTVLDACPPVLVPAGRLCHLMECSGEGWKDYVTNAGLTRPNPA